jgi:uncharacterized membrane protein
MAERPGTADPQRGARWVLLAGVLLSVTLISVGLLLMLVTNAPHRSHVLSPRQSFAEALRLRPTPWLDLGILVLMVTPIANVLMALITFARQRDWRYVLICLGILAVLTLSVTLGGGH